MEKRDNTKQEQYSNTPWPRPGLQGQRSTGSTSEILQRQQRIPGKSRQGRPVLQYSKKMPGFTLLEVMIAIAIIAIALVAVFGSQSQSLSLANEAKFITTAALLAQSKMAEVETLSPGDLVSDSGDFGEDFPDYHWDLTVSDIEFAGAEEVSEYLKQIDLSLSYGEHGKYKYRLKLYRFVPKTM